MGGQRGKRRKWKKKRRIIRAVTVSGDTFLIKEDLREHGFRWNEAERLWWRRSAGLTEDTVSWLRSFTGIHIEFGARVVA